MNEWGDSIDADVHVSDWKAKTFKVPMYDPWLFPLTLLSCLLAAYSGWSFEDYLIMGQGFGLPLKFSNSLGTAGFFIAVLALVFFSFSYSIVPLVPRIFQYSLHATFTLSSFLFGYGLLRHGELNFDLWYPLFESWGPACIAILLSGFLFNQLLVPIRLYRGSTDPSLSRKIRSYVSHQFHVTRIAWFASFGVLLIFYFCFRSGTFFQQFHFTVPIVSGIITGLGLYLLFLLGSFHHLPNAGMYLMLGVLVPALLGSSLQPTAFKNAVLYNLHFPATAVPFALTALVLFVVLLAKSARSPGQLLERTAVSDFDANNCVQEKNSPPISWKKLVAISLVLAVSHFFPYAYDLPFALESGLSVWKTPWQLAQIRRINGSLEFRQAKQGLIPRVSVNAKGEIYRLRLADEQACSITWKSLLDELQSTVPSFHLEILPYKSVQTLKGKIVAKHIEIDGSAINAGQLAKEVQPLQLSSVVISNSEINANWLEIISSYQYRFKNCTFSPELIEELWNVPSMIVLDNCSLTNSNYHISLANQVNEIRFGDLDQIQLSETAFAELLGSKLISISTKSESLQPWMDAQQYSVAFQEAVLRTLRTKGMRGDSSIVIGPLKIGLDIQLPKSMTIGYLETNEIGALTKLRTPNSSKKKLPMPDLQHVYLGYLREVSLRQGSFFRFVNGTDARQLPRLETLQCIETGPPWASLREVSLFLDSLPTSGLQTLSLPFSLVDFLPQYKHFPNLRNVGIMLDDFPDQDCLEFLAGLQLEELRFHLPDYAIDPEGWSERTKDKWRESFADAEIRAKIIVVFQNELLDFNKELSAEADEVKFDVIQESQKTKQ